jgi:hypothetical protein
MDNTQERLDKLEARVDSLEKALSIEGVEKPAAAKSAAYEGLAGGIRMLMANGFFDQPKAIAEIISELNREGYYNTHAGVASTLLITFVGKQKTLTRIKQGKKWAYVMRK